MPNLVPHGLRLFTVRPDCQSRYRRLFLVRPPSPVSVPHKAVIHVVCVNVVSGDRPRGITASRKGALGVTSARPRNIERSDGAVRSAHEAVIHVVPVGEESCDCSARVDAVRTGSLVSAGARTLEHRRS